MQPTLSVKWKIFRIISYLHIVFALCAGLIVVYDTLVLPDGLPIQRPIFYIINFSISLGCFVLIANSCINLFLLNRYYPDQLPGKSLRYLSYTFFAIGFLLVVANNIRVLPLLETFPKLSLTLIRGVPYLGSFVMTGLTGLYILWSQVVLYRLLHRNHKTDIDRFLNN